MIKSKKKKKLQTTEANIITISYYTDSLEIKNNTRMLIITNFAQHFREALARAIKQGKDKTKGIRIILAGRVPWTKEPSGL